MNISKNINDFMKKLSQGPPTHYVKENTTILLDSTLQKISNDLEIGQLTLAKPLYTANIPIDAKSVSTLLLDEKILGLNQFFVWGIVAKSTFYLLIGTEIDFFTKRTANNPFQESDNFFVFTEKIKKNLGLYFCQLYTSDDGFYLTTDDVVSKKMSFFLYKV